MGWVFSMQTSSPTRMTAQGVSAALLFPIQMPYSPFSTIQPCFSSEKEAKTFWGMEMVRVWLCSGASRRVLAKPASRRSSRAPPFWGQDR